MANKKESTFTNMVLVLFIITLVSSATLGIVYKLTKEPILKAKLEKKMNAITEVVPEFDNNPSTEMYTVKIGTDEIEFYPATKNGKLVGTAIKTFTKNGFAGYIWVMVGLKPNGEIINYSVLEHKETPGLGTKMEPWFKTTDPTKIKASIIGKNPGVQKFIVSKDGGDIDAITAATISSRAFLQAVQLSYNEYMKIQKKGGDK